MIRRFAAALLLLFAVPVFAATHSAPSSRVRTPVTYDTAIGTGVDDQGFASLPLRAGAHRYFVNSSTGSDGNTCTAAQSPSTPVATVTAGIACVADGNGDQLLVAQGTSYSGGLPSLVGKSGFSATYPTVVQSYDPADALNEAKYGRATAGNRPAFSAALGLTGGTGTAPKYLVWRGFVVDPGNVSGNVVSILTNATGSLDYILLENNVFRYTMLNADEASSSGGAGTHFILRNNAITGAWDTSAHAQGIYLDTWSSYTLEDNVFYHNGWKIGGSRDDAVTAGGPTQFRHPVYAQDNTTGIIRRNLMIDGAADGGSPRGDITFTENLVIDAPIGVGAGGGLNYNTSRPSGVNVEVSYNAFLGDADLNTASPRGTGMTTMNGKPGSTTHHNLWARSRGPGSSNYTLETDAHFNQPSYMDYFNNVAYLWSLSGQSKINGDSYPAQDFSSFESNVWDDPTSGSNTNVSSFSPPKPYTASELYAAIGYADKASFVAYVIEHPEAHLQRIARSLLFAGYGLTGKLATLAPSTATLVNSVSSSGQINGAVSGSTVTSSGLPTGLTINGAARTFAWDGTGAVGSGSYTLTETPTAGKNARVTTVSYSIISPPNTLNPSDKSASITLSNANLTATASSSIGPFAVRAVRGASTGKYYWEVHTDAFNNSNIAGVADSTASLSSAYWGITANPDAAGWFSTTLRYNTTTQTVASVATGHTLSFALDAGAKKLWVAFDGTWQNGDPVAGTSGLSLTGIGTPIFPAWQGDGSDKATFNFGGSPYTYTPPTGYGNMLLPLLFLVRRRRKKVPAANDNEDGLAEAA